MNFDKGYLIAALESASAKAAYRHAQVNRIASALENDRATVDGAVIWLKEMGGLDWLDATTIGLVTKDTTPVGKK